MRARTCPAGAASPARLRRRKEAGAGAGASAAGLGRLEWPGPGAPSAGPCACCLARAPTMARSLVGCCWPWCLSDDEKAAARVDKEINRQLLEQKRRERGELKLLLLGEPRRRPPGRAGTDGQTDRRTHARTRGATGARGGGPAPDRTGGSCPPGPARPTRSSCVNGKE